MARNPSTTPTRRRSLLQKLGFKRKTSLVPSSQSQAADLVPLSMDLPWDVLVLILEQADTSTLASLGRVSYDFLVLTAPLLYRDVTLKSVREIESFFCERKELSEWSLEQSRIDYLLSLNLTQTLTIDVASSPSSDFTSRSLTVYPDRTDSPNLQPIPITSLRITRRFDQRFTLKPLLHHVFPHLNPLQVEFNEEGRPDWASSLWELDRVFPLLEVWTRVKEVTVRGVFLISEVHPSFNWVPSSGAESCRFKLDLSSLLCSFYPNPRDFLARFVKEVETRMGAKNGDRKGSLVVVVKDEEQKVVAEEAVESIGDRWRHLFSVELEV